MAGMIYSEGYCVIYGIHQEDEGGVHVHFVVNTVSWRTGRKRHENIGENPVSQTVICADCAARDEASFRFG